MQDSFGRSAYTERGSMSGQRSNYNAGMGRSSGPGRKLTALCSHCESPLSQDEVLLSSATEGRCVACQQLIEAQSACRVCHLPWTDNATNNNVVPCDACGFFMHENCVMKGALQSKSGGRLYTYCPHCPPVLPSNGGGSGGRDTGRESGSFKAGSGSERGGGGGGGRHSQASLALALSESSPPPQPSLNQPVSLGDGRGGAAPLAALHQPQPSLQQVAALLRGQLQMLQNQQQELLRQYEQHLRGLTPEMPPTAFSLFQLDMFRVYQEEGFDIDPAELQPIIHNAWQQLTPDERAGYDNRAQQELAAWSVNAQLYVQLYGEYEVLASHVGVQADSSMLPKAMHAMLVAARHGQGQGGGSGGSGMGSGLGGGVGERGQLAAGRGGGGGGGSGRGPGRPPGPSSAAAAAGRGGAYGVAGGGGSGGGGTGGRGVKRQALDALAGASALLGMGMGHRGGMGGSGVGEDDDDDDEDYEAEAAKRGRRAFSPAVMPSMPASRPPPRNTRLPAEKLPTGIADLPQQINVSCNEVAGVFIMDGIKVLCHCKDCQDAPRHQREFHPTHWEQHCGAGTAKKWKASIKIEPGGAPEVPAGGNPMQIGKWFDMLGVEFRPAKTTGGPPVLEFTGATIRRQEADGMGAAGSGGGAATHPQLPPSSAPQHSQSMPASTPPPSQQLPSMPPSQPPRSGRPQAPTPPQRGGGTTSLSVGVNANSGGGGGGGMRRNEDGPGGGGGGGITISGTTGGVSKPPRPPVSATPWLDVLNPGLFSPVVIKWPGDRCCVCDSDLDYDTDQLVTCDGCGVTVHQTCYGVQQAPGLDDLWLCRACEVQAHGLPPGAPRPQCCLCPVAGGPLKPATLPGLWVHSTCMKWISEVTCRDPIRMEPADNLPNIQRERWELTCCLCRQRMGAKMQCAHCYQAFHAVCGRLAGLHMEMTAEGRAEGGRVGGSGCGGGDGAGGGTNGRGFPVGDVGGGLRIIAYCPKHCKPQPRMAGVAAALPGLQRPSRVGRGAAAAAAAAASKQPPSDEGSVNGLWNGQPFPPGPAIPVPPTPSGCARAEAIVLERVSHGTGNGFTTVKGFWIPEPLTPATPAPAAEAPPPSAPSGTITPTPNDLPPPPPPPQTRTGGGRRGGRRGGSRSAFSGAARAAAATPTPPTTSGAAAASPAPGGGGEVCGPLEAVDLLPLPEDVPESLCVVCCGRSAVFHVRSQRVSYEGEVMPVAIFERMCGRGDAKKWKSTLWVLDPDGGPQCQLGEWLSVRRVDRNALARLLANNAAHEAYCAWVQAQGAQGVGQEEVGQEEQGATRLSTPLEEEQRPGDVAEEGRRGGVQAVLEGAGAGGGRGGATDGEGVGGREDASVQIGGGEMVVGEAGQEEGEVGEERCGAVGPVSGGGGPATMREHGGDAGAGPRHVEATAAAAGSGAGGAMEMMSCDAADGRIAVVTAEVETAQMKAEEMLPLQSGGRAERWKEDSMEGEGAEGAPSGGATSSAGGRENDTGSGGGGGGGGGGGDSVRRWGAAALGEECDGTVCVSAAAAAGTAAADAATVEGAGASRDHAAAAARKKAKDGSCPTLGQGAMSIAVSVPRVHATHAEAAQAPAQGQEQAHAAGTSAATARGPCRRLRLFHLDPPTRKSLLTWLTDQQGIVRLLPDGSASALPYACVGHCCRIYWYDDCEWYEADVQAYDETTGRHHLLYHSDDATEWIDLAEEERQGRVQWLPYNAEPEDWPPPPVVAPPPPLPPPPPPAAARLPPPPPMARAPSSASTALGTVATTGSGLDALASLAVGGGGATDGEGGEEVEEAAGPLIAPTGGADAVGWRIRCSVPPPPPTADAPPPPGPPPTFTALINSYDTTTGNHAVQLETGSFDVLTLSQLNVRWLECGAAARTAHERLVTAHQSRSAEEATAAAAAAASAAERRRLAPSEIPVICNGLTSAFLVSSAMVRLRDGRTLSPTEFERLAGKAASKKWKVTLRVLLPHGAPGPSLGDHLVELGLEEPPPPRPRSQLAQAIANLCAMRRRQGTRVRTPTTGADMQEAPGPATSIGEPGGGGGAARSGGAGGGHWSSGTLAAGGGGGAGAGAARAAPVGGRGSSQRVHRPGCTCVICKQARREGGRGPVAAAARAAAAAAAAAAANGPGGGGGGGGGGGSGERCRSGKQAYVPAVPQFIRGPLTHGFWSMPPTRCYTEQEYVALRAAEVAAEEAAAAAAASAAAAATDISWDPTASAAAAAGVAPSFGDTLPLGPPTLPTFPPTGPTTATTTIAGPGTCPGLPPPLFSSDPTPATPGLMAMSAGDPAAKGPGVSHIPPNSNHTQLTPLKQESAAAAMELHTLGLQHPPLPPHLLGAPGVVGGDGAQDVHVKTDPQQQQQAVPSGILGPGGGGGGGGEGGSPMAADGGSGSGGGGGGGSEYPLGVGPVLASLLRLPPRHPQLPGQGQGQGQQHLHQAQGALVGPMQQNMVALQHQHQQGYPQQHGQSPQQLLAVSAGAGRTSRGGETEGASSAGGGCDSLQQQLQQLAAGCLPPALNMSGQDVAGGGGRGLSALTSQAAAAAAAAWGAEDTGALYQQQQQQQLLDGFTTGVVEVQVLDGLNGGVAATIGRAASQSAEEDVKPPGGQGGPNVDGGMEAIDRRAVWNMEGEAGGELSANALAAGMSGFALQAAAATGGLQMVPFAPAIVDGDGSCGDDAGWWYGSGASTVRRPKAVRWEERLRAALRSERGRITFGKSGIHGWGIFARVDIPQDTVVTEFRGEVLRPVLADLRERRYRAQGRDCFLFHVNREVVLDSTHLGHYGRFANHCCAPSMYTRVLEFGDGRVRLVFLARTDIRAGQELTFDYRFKEEEGQHKVACRCGAPGCKGTLN